MAANEAINSVFQDVAETIVTGRPQGFVLFALFFFSIAGLFWFLGRLGWLR
jgi:hypothetical protein